MSLTGHIDLYGKNPYAEWLTDTDYREVVTAAVKKLAFFMEEEFVRGRIKRDSFAVCLLDPTAPAWAQSDFIVLFVAEIGPDGEKYADNAFAKVCKLRDSGRHFDELVRRPWLLRSGDFRYKGAVCRDGTYVGGSGLSADDDENMSDRLASYFNAEINLAYHAWVADHPRDGDGQTWSWLSWSNTPAVYYQLDQVTENYEEVESFDFET